MLSWRLGGLGLFLTTDNMVVLDLELLICAPSICNVSHVVKTWVTLSKNSYKSKTKSDMMPFQLLADSLSLGNLLLKKTIIPLSGSGCDWKG